MDTDQPNHWEDIKMEMAPTAAEVAAKLLVEIQKHSMNSK
jgi:hypothetical protein